MRFDNLHILNLLGLLPLLAWGLHALFHYRRSVMARFADPHLLDQLARDFSFQRQKIKAALFMAAFFFFVVALARPQWGYHLQQVKRHGLDIMVAIDVSKSMLTRDVRPSRLERTKLAVKDLIKQLKGDRIGLIAFAGEAFVMCPLTSDPNGFLLSLEDLSVDSIPRGGTDLAKAIEESIQGEGGGQPTYKTVVLITDGEEGEGDALQAARKAREQGLRIYTVGVGTKEGDLIQIPNGEGQTEFLKDDQGNVVKSRLNENLLQQIAYITGGAYVHSGGAQFGLDYLYEQQLSKLEKRDIEAKMTKQYHERFQWPLTLGFVFLLAETLLGLRVFIFIVLLLCAPSAWADRQEALDYNQGTTFYKQADYTQASRYLQKAVNAKDKTVALRAKYNLGNTLYRTATRKQGGNLEGAIDDLQRALDFYEPLKAKDADARYNYDFVKKKLEELKRKKEQQQKKESQGAGNKSQDVSLPRPQAGHKPQESKEQKQQSQQNMPSQNEQQKQEQKQQSKQKSQDANEASRKSQESKEQKQQEVQGAKDAQKASEQEARVLLEDYERNEEPKGLANFQQRKTEERPVLKDW